jgi:hypothetical protein
MIKALEPRTEDGWSEEKHKEKAKAQAWLHLATAAGVLLILAALVSHGSVSIVVMWVAAPMPILLHRPALCAYKWCKSTDRRMRTAQ